VDACGGCACRSDVLREPLRRYALCRSRYRTVLYFSPDGRRLRKATSSFPSIVYTVSAATVVNGGIYAGTYEHGVCQSTNCGKDWIQFSRGLDAAGAGDIAHFASKDGILLVGTLGRGVFEMIPAGWRAMAGYPSTIAGNVFSMLSKSRTNGLSWGPTATAVINGLRTFFATVESTL